MTDQIIIGYSDHLDDLVCHVCDVEFDEQQLRVHVVELNSRLKEIEYPDSIGSLQRRMVASNRFIIMHAGGCFDRYKKNKRDYFETVALKDCIREHLKSNRSISERHSPLFSMYEYYYNGQENELTISPTLQETEPHAVSAMINHSPSSHEVFNISDKFRWTTQQLNYFLQRFTQINATMQSSANYLDRRISTQFSNEFMNAEHFKSINTTHRHHIWTQQLELTDRIASHRFIIWQGPNEEELKKLYNMFMADPSVTWSDLIIRSNPITPFNKAFNDMIKQIDADCASIITVGLKKRKLPSELTPYNATFKYSTPIVTRFSQVEYTENKQQDKDEYIIRLNAQSTAIERDYFMINWKWTEATSSKTPNNHHTPQLTQVYGSMPEPGIPVEIKNTKTVIHDIDQSFKCCKEDNLIKLI
jgi:hypothetical protein